MLLKVKTINIPFLRNSRKVADSFTTDIPFLRKHVGARRPRPTIADGNRGWKPLQQCKSVGARRPRPTIGDGNRGWGARL